MGGVFSTVGLSLREPCYNGRGVGLWRQGLLREGIFDRKAQDGGGANLR